MIRYSTTLESLQNQISAEAPNWLDSARTKTASFRKLKRYSEASSNWSDVKSVYVRVQHGKCAYCERKLEEGDVGKIEWDIEHFRPKSSVKSWPPKSHRLSFEFRLGPATGNGYYLLPYHPLNYPASCKVCNSPLKSDYFPIAASRRRLAASDPREIFSEKPFLVYPLGDYDADPESILTFQGFICVPVAASGHRRHRALVTIAFFGLNDRDTLLKQRAELLIGTWVMLERLENDPNDQIGGEFIDNIEKPWFKHANCARSFIRVYRQERNLAKTFVQNARDYCRSKGGC